MKLPRLFLQIKYACQTHGLAKDVSLARTFLLAVAKANSKRNFAKSGKITFILFYLHFILFLKTSTEFGSPLSARFLKGFSAYEALLFAHLTLNCMSGKEHLCIFGSSEVYVRDLLKVSAFCICIRFFFTSLLICLLNQSYD